MEKINSKFRLADKLGYESPFDNSPFRKDWQEKRERAEEKRREMSIQQLDYQKKLSPDLNDVEIEFVKFLFKIRNLS